jgi:hypothetical protein
VGGSRPRIADCPRAEDRLVRAARIDRGHGCGLAQGRLRITHGQSHEITAHRILPALLRQCIDPRARSGDILLRPLCQCDLHGLIALAVLERTRALRRRARIDFRPAPHGTDEHHFTELARRILRHGQRERDLLGGKLRGDRQHLQYAREADGILR